MTATNDRRNSISASQTEVCDHRTVPLDVVVLDVIKKTTALTHQHQQPSPTVMVLFVDLQVFGEVSDAFGEQCDLDLRRASIVFG